MKKAKFLSQAGRAGFALNALLLVTLTGCVGYVDGPHAEVAVASPVFVAQDDYVYYPSYGVYFSSSRGQYAYMSGGAWVSRPAPFGVSVDVLRASPSVRMDFHDSPANHQAAMARQYPKNWKPNHSPQGRQEGRKEDERGGR